MKGFGFSIVEILMVVFLVALVILMLLPTINSERHYQDVGRAMYKAQQLASEIEYARSIGVVGLYSGGLDNFVNYYGAVIDQYMPGVSDNHPVAGVLPRDLYQIEVGNYSVLVSFSFDGAEYADFNFPSSVKTSKLIHQQGSQVRRVTWTVAPSAGNGLQIAYSENQYINAR
jgi:type II secretory pathway pseudopilin PulG